MKRIIVSVTNDLNTDQRVAKVCNTLRTNGYEIILVGRKLKDSKPITRPYRTKRFSLLFNNGFLFYANYNIRLFIFLLFAKKDILLANDLDTLLTNYLASKIQNKKLIYDSHELFPEIPELTNRSTVKKVWSWLEKMLLPKLKNSYTVCKSIADYYQEKYQTNFKVIKNLPLKKEVALGEFPFKIDDKKVILYQGAINVGRGLELMINTMPMLKNYILVIIGSGDILNDLKKLVIDKNLQHQVHFLGRILPEELQKLTPLATLGISLEEDLGLNYKFALPNKIFDYIQAEVPILVSNLPEMKQVVNHYKVGEILEKRTPKNLADLIKYISTNNYTNQLKKAKQELIWQQQEQELIAIFENCK